MVPEELLVELDRRLEPVDAARLAAYPGESPDRQPVHTCYVPADAVVPGLSTAWGTAALAALDEHGLPDLGLDPALVDEVLPRVRAKLATEPVEDLRVDAEDGYRGGPGAEDGDVRAAAAVLAAEPVRPAYLGIRAKSLEGPTRRRGVRTLDLFLVGLAGSGRQRAIVTLPKVTAAEQVAAFLPVLDALEQSAGLGLDLELQVETPQAVLGADGTTTLARMLHAGGGRVTGLHHGTYDYSASLGIAAAHQSADHPAADAAKQAMQVAVAGTAARAVDGSSNVLPVGERAQVHAAWVLHAGLVRRALERGFYQGWDLHPAQLVTRYVATYAFFRAALPAAAARLDAYVHEVAGGVLDEPATARALATVVLRGLDCGALDAGEVQVATGLDRAGLDRLAGRRSGAG
ncbi:aldolase [Modestobacter lapidis]|nr:aldolase [Modestobacter lapidis]